MLIRSKIDDSFILRSAFLALFDMLRNASEQVKVRETPLKNLFSLFQAQSLIELAELGDTWHPSDGFVDETILNNPKTVQDIIDFIESGI